MGRSTKEIAITYLPLFTQHLEDRGIAGQYEIQVKELGAPTLRFELHEIPPQRWVGTIEFEGRDILDLPASDGALRRIIAQRVDALLHPALQR